MKMCRAFFACLVALLCVFSSGTLSAQSTVNDIVRSQTVGNDIYIIIDPSALELFGDSVILSLNPDADSKWNTWKDALTNSNSPGMDVNFDGNNAYGIANLLVSGLISADSDLNLAGSLAINTNRFNVAGSTGNTLIGGTLGVSGLLTAANSLSVTGTGTFSDAISAASGSSVGNLTFADGSITDFSGAISFGDEALSTTGTAATGALTVTGTGSFSSTTSSASGSTVGNLTLADGSITDSSGAISFGDEALSTTGTLASGAQTVTGNVTASGTVQAEQLTSTDDLTVADVANIDGTLDLATGSITDSSGAISFGDEALSTTGTAATGALTVTGTGSFSSTTSSASGSTVGNLTLADGSITDSSGAISFGNEALSTTGTAATGALTVTGTGSFSSTTSSASGSTVGNLTLADGSITDSSGAISFGDEALSTTGTVATGALTVTGTGSFSSTTSSASGSTVGNLTLADGSITDSSGAISFGDEALSTTGALASGAQTVTGNVTASGTVQAEQLTSTDDLTVADVANIDGTLDLATGSITDQTGAISFGNENLSTTGDFNISSGTLTLADNQISGDKVEGGTIAAITISQLSGAMDANSQSMTNVNIDSGNIDGATIATSDVTIGANKTLDVSAGTLTLAAGQVTADKVGGGTFEAGTYSFAGSTVSDLGTITTADIDGGTIDGANIATSNVTIGTGKTLDVSAGTLTLDAGQIGADKISPGTFEAGVYSMLNSQLHDPWIQRPGLTDVVNFSLDGTGSIDPGANMYVDGSLVVRNGQSVIDPGAFMYVDGMLVVRSGQLHFWAGTTLDVQHASLTFAPDQISGDAINGGTIGDVTISQLNLPSGAESPATRSTVMGELIPAASTTNYAANTAPYNTGTYIDLTPGKWQLHINIQTDQGYQSMLTHGAGAGGGSIALGLSTNQLSYVAYPSQFHSETLVGGSLDGDHSIYDMIQGQPLIEVTSNVRLYLWVKSIVDDSGNTSASWSTWTSPASDAWDLNYLYAVPVNW